MTFTLPDFGQDADEYVPAVFDPDDIWIKKFKPGSHRLRLLVEPNKFTSYREHYSKVLSLSFPCTEDTNSCTMGCQSDHEATRKRQRFFAFNALDDQGRLNLFKVGVGVWEDLKDEQEEAGGSLLDRDITIIRKGTTMDDTRYKVRVGEPYPAPFDGEVYNIKQILAQHYMKALEASGADIENMLSQEAKSEAASIPDEEIKPAAKKAAPKGEATVTAIGNAEPVEDWPVSRMKAFLDEHEVEFPPRAARSVLEPLVEAQIKKVAGF